MADETPDDFLKRTAGGGGGTASTAGGETPEQFLARTGAAAPATTTPPANGNLAGGYVTLTGDYVPPQAIPGVTAQPNAQPVVPPNPAAVLGPEGTPAVQPAQPPPNAFWAPGGRDIVANSGWLGRNVLAPAGDVVGDVAGTVGQAVSGAQGLVANALTPISPTLARDVAALPEAFPLAGRELGAPNASAAPSPGDVRQGVRNVLTEPWRKDPVTGELKTPTTPTTGAPSAAAPSWTPGTNPATAADAGKIASFLLDKARDSGADLQAPYTNKFIDKVTADAEPAGPGTAAVSGPNDPVTAMVQRLQALKDQPLSIKDVMGMDAELNARKRAVINTDPDLARRLGNLQDTLRDQVDAATKADVGGGDAGWEAFTKGRAAYSQYKKMQQLEDIRDRAMGFDQSATKMQADITKWATDPRKSRGLDDAEINALKATGERGYMGELVRSAGGRLAAQTAGPVAGMLAGNALGGLTGFPAIGTMIGYGVGQAGEVAASTAIRRMAIRAQSARVDNALKMFGSKVQVPPDMPPS